MALHGPILSLKQPTSWWDCPENVYQWTFHHLFAVFVLFVLLFPSVLLCHSAVRFFLRSAGSLGNALFVYQLVNKGNHTWKTRHSTYNHRNSTRRCVQIPALHEWLGIDPGVKWRLKYLMKALTLHKPGLELQQGASYRCMQCSFKM